MNRIISNKNCTSCEHFKSYYDELDFLDNELLPKDYGFCLIFYDEEFDYRKDKGFGKNHVCPFWSKRK